MKKKVLIVDDDYSFIRKFVNSDNSNNVILSFADSVNRALDMLAYDSFDLIIANSNAPGGNLSNLKESIPPSSRILFLSSTDSDYQKIINSGEVCLHKYDVQSDFNYFSAYA